MSDAFTSAGSRGSATAEKAFGLLKASVKFQVPVPAQENPNPKREHKRLRPQLKPRFKENARGHEVLRIVGSINVGAGHSSSLPQLWTLLYLFRVAVKEYNVSYHGMDLQQIVRYLNCGNLMQVPYDLKYSSGVPVVPEGPCGSLVFAALQVLLCGGFGVYVCAAVVLAVLAPLLCGRDLQKMSRLKYRSVCSTSQKVGI